MSGQQSGVVFLSKLIAGCGIIALGVGWFVMPNDDAKIRIMRERIKKSDKFEKKQDDGLGLPAFLQRKTPDDIRRQQSQPKPAMKAPENVSKEQLNVFKDL